MRHLTIIGLALAGLAFLPRGIQAQQPATCTVVYVLDADTVNCEGGLVVRLLLIDAPERGDLGDEARAFVVGLAPKGSSLRLEYDEKPQDSQGRWLAYAFLPDGTLLNKRLIEAGFAYVEFSAQNQARLQELRKAELGARSEKMGLWAQ